MTDHSQVHEVVDFGNVEVFAHAGRQETHEYCKG